MQKARNVCEETISSDYAAAGVEIITVMKLSASSSKANLTFVSDVEDTRSGPFPFISRQLLPRSERISNASCWAVADEDFDVVEMVASSRNKTLERFLDGNNLSSICSRIRGHQTKPESSQKGWINLANPESGYDSASYELASGQVGEYHDTRFISTKSIQLERVTRLALVFNTYDPSDLTVEHPYSDLQTGQAAIPIVEKDPRLKKNKLSTPSATDTDYAKLPEIERAALVAPEVHYKKNIRFKSRTPFPISQTLPEKDEQIPGSNKIRATLILHSCILWASLFHKDLLAEDPQK